MPVLSQAAGPSDTRHCEAARRTEAGVLSALSAYRLLKTTESPRRSLPLKVSFWEPLTEYGCVYDNIFVCVIPPRRGQFHRELPFTQGSHH